MSKQFNHATLKTESQEQAEFVRRFKLEFPGVLIYAIRNGVKSPKEKSQGKIQGVVNGVPDLCVPAWALYIEMKEAGGGALSPQQKIILPHLGELGYNFFVAFGADDALRQCEAYREVKLNAVFDWDALEKSDQKKNPKTKHVL